MTRRQNRIFIGVGCIGVVLFVASFAINAFLRSRGHREFGDFVGAHLGYLLVPTFICLVWFGIMPIAGTRQYLSDRYDDPKYDFTNEWPFYRFWGLISDDARVISKRTAELAKRTGITREQAASIIERHPWNREAANRAAGLLKT